MQFVLRKSLVCLPFVKSLKSEWEPELYLWVNLSEFRNVSSGDSG